MSFETIIGTIAGTVTGAIIGGAITFVIQRSFWYRKVKREIYQPLLDEMKNVRESVTSFSPWLPTPAWLKITGNSRHYEITRPLRNDLLVFFNVKLHNFSVFCNACTNIIKSFIENDLERIGKGLGQSNDGRFLEDRLSSLVLQKSETGGYWGNITPDMYNQNYKDVKKHIGLNGETSEDYVKYVFEQTKAHPLLKTKEEEMMKITKIVDSLINKLEWKVDFWDKLKERFFPKNMGKVV